VDQRLAGVAARALGEPATQLRLAYALIPLGGVGVFLGLSALTVTLLTAEGVTLTQLPELRGALLAVATAASLALAYVQIGRSAASPLRRAAALLAFATAAAGAVVPWVMMYYVW